MDGLRWREGEEKGELAWDVTDMSYTRVFSNNSCRFAASILTQFTYCRYFPPQMIFKRLNGF